MALGAASIYFTDPQKKVLGGLSVSRDSLLDGLVTSVLSTTFLFGLGIDKRPQTVAEKADQDRLQDHRVGIEFLKDGL